MTNRTPEQLVQETRARIEAIYLEARLRHLANLEQGIEALCMAAVKPVADAVIARARNG